jgi:uncharacterized membrane protein YebE (DUF533 family)
MGSPVEYVECDSCRNTYRSEVLRSQARPSQGEMVATYQEGVLRIMVAIMAADGELAAAEVETIATAYSALTSRTLSTEEIELEARGIQRAGIPVEKYLLELEPFLNEPGKEFIIKAAFMVAAADGHLADAEKALLGRVKRALAISDAHLRGIIADMSSRRSSTGAT